MALAPCKRRMGAGAGLGVKLRGWHGVSDVLWLINAWDSSGSLFPLELCGNPRLRARIEN